MTQMKDSGVKWIGQVPEMWNKIKLKNVVLFEKGKNAALYTAEYIGMNQGEYPVYSGQTENDGIMGFINSYDYDLDKCLFTTTVGAKAMTTKILIGKFSLSQNCLIMLKKQECSLIYIYYSLNPLFNYERSLIPSHMQPSLRIEDLKSYDIPLPTLQEQIKIADFLDKKCNQIDNLIEIQEKEIDKLKEYRTSVITKAVTKGVNSNVQMKDSGIDWIGKIPKSWELQRLKFISTYNDDSLSDNENPNLLINYVDIGSVSLNDGIKEIQEFSFRDAPSRARRKTRKGDIIVSTVRTYLKSIASIQRNDLIVSTGFCVIRPKNQEEQKFIEYFCKSSVFTDNVSANSYGISYPAINSVALMDMHIPYPNIKDINVIVQYLDEECSRISNLINIKQNKIIQLEKFKQSLIYEYVTGKKQVND